jgi:peptide/nickel transport system permease protein
MQSYLLKRLGVLPFVALGVTLLTFSLMHLMPGDPAQLIARSRFGEQVTEEEVRRVRQQEGLDRPLPLQYVHWLGRLARGDMGRSIETGRPVIRELLGRWPQTLILASVALLISGITGIPFGALCGARKDSVLADIGMSAGILGVSLPVFWLALLLILLFDLQLGWFPSHGSGGPEAIVLPAMTLGTGMAALTLRVTRSRMAAVMGEEFIRRARARGISEWSVVAKHALKNTLIPVVTVLGLQFGRLLEGAVIVETIFGRPGIGRLLVQSIFARDFPVVQGCVLTIAIVFLWVNLCVDIVYTWLDPRIHYRKGG